MMVLILRPVGNLGTKPGFSLLKTALERTKRYILPNLTKGQDWLQEMTTEGLPRWAAKD